MCKYRDESLFVHTASRRRRHCHHWTCLFFDPGRRFVDNKSVKGFARHEKRR